MQEMEAQETKQEVHLTYRDWVDAALLFVCPIALGLNIILWAVATAFSHLGFFSNILSLLITLLLAVTGIVLLLRYIDICLLSYQAYVEPGNREEDIPTTVGAGFFCIFLVVSIIVCLSQSGILEGWHYTLIGAELFFTGYQVWRIFTQRNKK